MAYSIMQVPENDKCYLLPGDGLAAGQVGDVNECVIEWGVDVSHTEHQLSLSHLSDVSILKPTGLFGKQ